MRVVLLDAASEGECSDAGAIDRSAAGIGAGRIALALAKRGVFVVVGDRFRFHTQRSERVLADGGQRVVEM